MIVVAEEQIAQYREQGFTILPQALSPAEVAALQAETLACIEAATPDADHHFQPSPDGAQCLIRIQSLTEKGDALLTHMANPVVLDRVTRILGPDMCCYATAMILKTVDGGVPIAPHRDVVDRTATGFLPGICSVDVYIDDADETNGCLEVVPGSHLIPDVAASCGHWDVPGLTAVPMRAGDVLLHDGMLIHASRGTSAGGKWRRVLYPTFQSADKMAREGAYPGPPAPREWIAKHLKLMAHAVAERAASGYPEEPYPYQVPANWRGDVEAAPLELRSG